jgi:solute carrier family 8 (sodium/calcium exchanger)
MLHPTKKENGEIDDVTCCEAFIHFIAIGWKVLFACVPPPHYIGGWACFIVSLIFMGFVTALLAEVANLWSCIFGIKIGLTAITIIVFGTSIPDALASRSAANKGRYADESIGVITGSNAANVFLGLGLPWVIASVYHYNKVIPAGGVASGYVIPAKGLTVAVICYIVLSICAFFILMCRRGVVKGELGGNDLSRWCSTFVFLLFWVIFLIVASLGFYGVLADI